MLKDKLLLFLSKASEMTKLKLESLSHLIINVVQLRSCFDLIVKLSHLSCQWKPNPNLCNVELTTSKWKAIFQITVSKISVSQKWINIWNDKSFGSLYSEPWAEPQNRGHESYLIKFLETKISAENLITFEAYSHFELTFHVIMGRVQQKYNFHTFSLVKC